MKSGADSGKAGEVSMKSLHSALRLRLSASARLGNEPVTASYHIYSGTECETRSIMRALVPNPARSGRRHF